MRLTLNYHNGITYSTQDKIVCINAEDDNEDDDESQSSCESWNITTNDDTGYGRTQHDYSTLEIADIKSFIKALSDLTYKDKHVYCPCGNDMEHWRESNAQNIVAKGKRYHCGTKSRPLKGMMQHAKDTCIKKKCPLHLAFYLRLAYLYKKRCDAEFFAIFMSYTNNND